ncbi:hypothetical protein [Enterobacter bugandensis]|uniref:hypothetical protein n=1 Tax=Enterobacter bugandensis TaxID=881260 RepID=UPI002FD00BDF
MYANKSKIDLVHQQIIEPDTEAPNGLVESSEVNDPENATIQGDVADSSATGHSKIDKIIDQLKARDFLLPFGADSYIKFDSFSASLHIKAHGRPGITGSDYLRASKVAKVIRAYCESKRINLNHIGSIRLLSCYGRDGLIGSQAQALADEFNVKVTAMKGKYSGLHLQMRGDDFRAVSPHGADEIQKRKATKRLNKVLSKSSITFLDIRHFLSSLN